MSKLVFDFGEGEPPMVGGSPAERREGARSSTLLRPAKLVVDDREFLCVVRNVSEGGLNLQLFHALPEFEFLSIEFDNGEKRAIRRVWQSGEQIGCAFLYPLEDRSVVTAQAGERPRRQPRLQVEHEAMLFAGDISAPIVLRDISQKGASIDAPHWLMIDELVRIESATLPPIYAKVRWRRPPRYGLVFEQVFGMAELAKLCSEI